METTQKIKRKPGRKSASREIIHAKKIIIDTGEETITYDLENIKQVFKIRPAGRGRLHLGTNNRVVVIELKEASA